ncbi:hypothetical protein LX32DRAFT_110293 [Colletotrichum zoysiae]|uniref:Uncharacterized protein n=1 Tax=Colletotrichum zoysiae TaxID=1216348 RepID=A0AAD9LX29_9PEZI|nr:hypothetical protein LX32DRAFT_110293 [Colletotrichum zoysiae]
MAQRRTRPSRGPYRTLCCSKKQIVPCRPIRKKDPSGPVCRASSSFLVLVRVTVTASSPVDRDRRFLAHPPRQHHHVFLRPPPPPPLLKNDDESSPSHFCHFWLAGRVYQCFSFLDLPVRVDRPMLGVHMEGRGALEQKNGRFSLDQGDYPSMLYLWAMETRNRWLGWPMFRSSKTALRLRCVTGPHVVVV